MSATKTVSLYGDEIQITFHEAKHFYETNQGIKVPGVTTVLSRAAKPALIQWAANMAAESYDLEIDTILQTSTLSPDVTLDYIALTQDDILKRAKKAHRQKATDAANIGTEVHQFAEDCLKGLRPKIPKGDAQKGCQAFLDWLEDYDLTNGVSEQIVFSWDHFFAGTCDYYGKVNGELCVLDLKTSKGIYPEHWLQTSAYQIALEEMFGVEIPWRWIIHLDKATGKFRAYRRGRSQMEIDAFLALRDYHRAMTEIERTK